MVDINFLRGLSDKGAVNLLLQEGYIEMDYIQKEIDEYNRLFLYPYVLQADETVIDCIYYAEYCNLVVDEEYCDGRMTWEPCKVEWVRRCPLTE